MHSVLLPEQTMDIALALLFSNDQ